jgi:hypothetical protein
MISPRFNIGILPRITIAIGIRPASISRPPKANSISLETTLLVHLTTKIL